MTRYKLVIEYDGEHSDRAAFRVFDTGPGVPTGHRKQIFDIGFSTKTETPAWAASIVAGSCRSGGSAIIAPSTW